MGVRNLEILENTTDARGRKLEVVMVHCPPPLFRTYKEAAGVHVSSPTLLSCPESLNSNEFHARRPFALFNVAKMLCPDGFCTMGIPSLDEVLSLCSVSFSFASAGTIVV